MRWIGIISALWKFVRDYGVILTLLTIFVVTVVQVYITGVGPTPQQPPEGYEVQRLEASLQWHKGNKGGAMTLEVSKDDPTFGELFVERQVSGTRHSVLNLEPGHTYYWRLKQDEAYSDTRSFKTSIHAIKF
jgi:hypothetical protein